MKLLNIMLVSVLLLSLIPFISAQQNEVNLYYFYGAGCPHCAKMSSFLSELKEKYPTLTVKEYETYSNQENRELFENMASSFNTKIEGVPTIFINNRVISGFSNTIAESIEEEVQKCLKEKCEDPIEKTKKPAEKTELSKITIPAIISAAAVDAINPCAFAVLILLLTTILASGIKRRALFAGLAFSLSIYISYFLMGIGLFSVIQTAGLTHLFYTIVAALAIIIGLFNLKDYLWYGKWFVMEVPFSWRPKLKNLIKHVTSIPGAFLIGFLVSLFLLPCTSGPYIVILGLLAKTATRDYALLLLLLYNLIFILPMLAITLAIYFGVITTEKAERWRTKKLKVLHLIAGIIILLLGIGMFIAMYLGLV